MITYSTNWMGPINENWIAKHGTGWCAGRIDIRDDSKEGYDGWHEYSLPPMNVVDWEDLSEWLDELETEELLSFHDLIEQFEHTVGKKIKWCKEDE